MGAGKVSAKSGQFDQISRKRLSAWFTALLVVDQLVQQSKLKAGKSQLRRSVGDRAVDHRQPEDAPAQDAQDREEVDEPLRGAEF